MEYLFIQREGDKAEIFKLYNEFKLLSKLDLVTEYQAQKICIVGSHAQAQRLVALHLAIKTVFKTSPIIIELQLIIRLSCTIGLESGNWVYKNDKQ